jgi:hypothetical protein
MPRAPRSLNLPPRSTCVTEPSARAGRNRHAIADLHVARHARLRRSSTRAVSLDRRFSVHGPITESAGTTALHAFSAAARARAEVPARRDPHGRSTRGAAARRVPWSQAEPAAQLAAGTPRCSATCSSASAAVRAGRRQALVAYYGRLRLCAPGKSSRAGAALRGGSRGPHATPRRQPRPRFPEQGARLRRRTAGRGCGSFAASA